MENINFKVNRTEYVIEFRAGGDANFHHDGWSARPSHLLHTTFLIHIYAVNSPAFRIEGTWSRGCCIESANDGVLIDSTQKEKEILETAEKELSHYFKKLP